MTPKNVLIVLAHPEPQSFSTAMATSAAEALRAAGHEVTVSDLYADGFRPDSGRHDFSTCADAARFHYQTEQAHAAAHGAFAPDIAREQARLAAADLLVLQFPLWWGGPPAMLKGWIDRVLAYGFAYVDGARFDKGLFRGRRAIMGVTTGGTPQRFSPGDAYGPIADVLMPVRRLALEYMGFEVADPFVAFAAPRVDDDARQAYLAEWAEAVTRLAALPTTRRQMADPTGLAPAAGWSSAG